MIGSSKILTVSYGTFSCTLEGFDDSFGTMKAIAEYFRDLAADDRYFGAEPATPDAEMLAKIAGHEINRQVEARIEDGSVTLRPSGQDAELAVEKAPVTAPTAPAPALAPQAVDIAQNDAPADAAEITEIAEPEVEAADEPAEQSLEVFEEPTQTPATPAPVDSESVAAKLRRIRAVVAQSKVSAASPVAFSEDQHAEEFLPEVDPENDAFEDEAYEDEGAIEETAAVAEAVADVDAQEADLEQPVVETEPAPETDSDAMAKIMDAVNDDDLAAETIADQDAQDDADSLEDADDTLDDTDIDLAKFLAVSDADDEEDNQEDGEEAANIFNNVQDTLGETTLCPDEEADLVAELANVELEQEEGDIARGINTMLRTERASRALHNEGDIQTEASVERLMDETDAKLDTDDSTRRRSVISHLRAAVAATVADRTENRKPVQTPEDENEAYRMDLADVVEPEKSEDKQEQHPEPVSPLILVSEQRVEAPKELQENLEVAPKPAAKTAPVKIRPRRIIVAPASVQDAVKTGREDQTPAAAPQSEPRGLAEISNDALIADSTSFADFAAKMGASELPDILEAAAAYNAFIEGKPNFRRPQIMRHAASLAGKEQFNREAGLRSFGQLLRQGKIIKIERGRFEIADTTRFKPAERFAGE